MGREKGIQEKRGIHTKSLKVIVMSVFLIFSVHGTLPQADYSVHLNPFQERQEDYIPASVIGIMRINTRMTQNT